MRDYRAELRESDSAIDRFIGKHNLLYNMTGRPDYICRDVLDFNTNLDDIENGGVVNFEGVLRYFAKHESGFYLQDETGGIDSSLWVENNKTDIILNKVVGESLIKDDLRNLKGGDTINEVRVIIDEDQVYLLNFSKYEPPKLKGGRRVMKFSLEELKPSFIYVGSD